VVLQTVEVLIAFTADFTAIWLLFLHAHGSRIWDRGDRIDDRVCAVAVLLEFLILVAMLNEPVSFYLIKLLSIGHTCL